MAINISSNPDDYSAAYSPILFTAASDSFSELERTPVLISNNGSGNCRFTFTSHSYNIGDLIEVTGASESTYNVTHEISAVTSNTFDTQIDYVSNDSCTTTRNNTNFQIKAEVLIFNSSRATINSIANGGGGEITVTTSSAHGYSVGNYVSIEGSDNYDGIYKVESVGSTTTFNVIATYGASETGYSRKGTIQGRKAQNIGYDFIFNVSGILQTVLSYNIQELSGATPRIIEPTDESIILYGLLLTEQHDDIDGVLTEYETKLSDAKKVINATYDFREDQDLDDFIITTTPSTTQRFLTNSPKNLHLQVGEWIQLSFLFDGNDQIKVRTIKYTSGVPTTDDSANFIIDGNRGIAMIQMTDVDYIEVFLINSTPKQISETITLTKSSYCQGQRIWFFNQRGGFDSYTFTGYKERMLTAKDEKFTKPLTDSFTPSDAGMTVINVVGYNSFDLYSHTESEENMIWLEDLKTSPLIFIEEDDELIQIILTERNQTTYKPDDLTRPYIKFMYANHKIIQRQ